MLNPRVRFYHYERDLWLPPGRPIHENRARSTRPPGLDRPGGLQVRRRQGSAPVRGGFRHESAINAAAFDDALSVKR